ncbi:alanine--glyoxylate aminotransferase family protein [Cytobacillus sp. OWB-43]|uniref:pyridoxal-phosphate-dependent aminotransferase family protein n=1 Tax=Cytobacillus sp. OWB-43 TaxID=3108468 RepID=UPI002AFE85F4|nr:alanine--glyoxylate aminotransferase family protein [Cytobacillus sp. OWB-43]MEA1854569.1 alanine--glyoxylate aminotransferase family protein [Cytobacillus sp. OWB-43]
MGFNSLNTPSRTIMTPGPVEVDPRVLRAMSTPILGQFDPAFTKLMNEVMEMIRQVFQTKNRWAFPIDGTSRAGNEALLASIIEPGDKVFVPIYGRFGHLLVEICERYGADVYSIQCPWGEVFDPDVVIAEMAKISPKVVAIVHGETSTGRMQPLEKIGKACREQDAILVVDAVASIGGVEVKTDDWFIDGLIGGTQKCLSVPAGMAPITFNERIEKLILERKKVEAGIATAEDEQYQRSRMAIASNYFDLAMLMDYWSPRRLNHHTEATSMVYALYEGLRLVLEEGLKPRFIRHLLHEKALVTGIQAMGLKLYGDSEHKLPCVTCIEIPAGVDGESVRKMLLKEFSIEIASSFGPLQGKIWRIGTMGYSCRKENVLAVLGGLEAVLIRHEVQVNRGEALQAAMDIYAAEESSAMTIL